MIKCSVTINHCPRSLCLNFRRAKVSVFIYLEFCFHRALVRFLWHEYFPFLKVTYRMSYLLLEQVSRRLWIVSGDLEFDPCAVGGCGRVCAVRGARRRASVVQRPSRRPSAIWGRQFSLLITTYIIRCKIFPRTFSRSRTELFPLAEDGEKNILQRSLLRVDIQRQESYINRKHFLRHRDESWIIFSKLR